MRACVRACGGNAVRDVAEQQRRFPKSKARTRRVITGVYRPLRDERRRYTSGVRITAEREINRHVGLQENVICMVECCARRWVDNIIEVGCGHVDWIGLAQDRDRWRTLVSAVMNLGVP